MAAERECVPHKRELCSFQWMIPLGCVLCQRVVGERLSAGLDARATFRYACLSASRTLAARLADEKGFWMNCTPSSSTPR